MQFHRRKQKTQKRSRPPAFALLLQIVAYHKGLFLCLHSAEQKMDLTLTNFDFFFIAFFTKTLLYFLRLSKIDGELLRFVNEDNSGLSPKFYFPLIKVLFVGKFASFLPCTGFSIIRGHEKEKFILALEFRTILLIVL